MIALLLSLAFAPAPCTAILGVQADGSIFMQRDAGWRQSTPKQIVDTMKAGCPSDQGAPPHRIAAVRIAISPSASAKSVQSVMDTVRTLGWTEDRVETTDWLHDEIPPR
jgi:hypothetical protein